MERYKYRQQVVHLIRKTYSPKDPFARPLRTYDRTDLTRDIYIGAAVCLEEIRENDKGTSYLPTFTFPKPGNCSRWVATRKWIAVFIDFPN
jgi:hypothetical protein